MNYRDSSLLNLKFISFSGAIRVRLNFKKYNKRRNISFKEEVVTRPFISYIGWTSLGRNNTQCTTYLKAKTKTNTINAMVKAAYTTTI